MGFPRESQFSLKYLLMKVFLFVLTGFTMFKTLTRSAFAQVQSRIFPMYFISGIIMSTISLFTHLYMNPVKSWQEDSLSLYQVCKAAAFVLFHAVYCTLIFLRPWDQAFSAWHELGRMARGRLVWPIHSYEIQQSCLPWKRRSIS